MGEQNSQGTLVTPDLRSLSQNFFAGENWFFYWRTSASLWESKLSQYRGATPLFIPFLWSHHVSKTSGPSGAKIQSDFGTKRADTNLIELFELTKKLGIDAVLLLPVGPLPFVSLGGIPAWLAEGVAQDEQGFNKVGVDAEGRIHKSYSYYASKVYREYAHVLNQLSDHLRSRQTNIKIYAMNSFYLNLNNEKVESYFEDHSSVAQQSFARYFATLKQEGKTAYTGSEVVATKKNWRDFHSHMKDLYLQTMEEFFAGNFQGEMKIFFSLTSSWQPLTRLKSTEISDSVLEMINFAWQRDMIPSQIFHRKEEDQQMANLYQATGPHQWLPMMVDASAQLTDQFAIRPLRLFEIFDQDEHGMACGLNAVLKQTFQGAWSLISKLDDALIECWDEPRIIFLFDLPVIQQIGPTDPSIKFILKMIMRGHQVVLDKSMLDPAQQRYIESFIAENSLKRIQVGHYSPFEMVAVGEAGKLCFFSSEDLKCHLPQIQAAFWQQVLRIFDLHFVAWELPKEVESLWLARSAASTELYYEQVRRVVLRNKSNENISMTLNKQPRHVLTKIIDPQGVEVLTRPHIVEVKFAPHGFVALDFGYLGEEE